MEIIVLMASAHDSHYHKRLNALKKAGHKVTAYGFQRNVSLDNSTLKDINLLPKVENGKYINRITTVYKAISHVIAKHGKNVIYYATTFDIAIVCFHKHVKYIYGISDLVHSSFPQFLRQLFIQIDKKLIRNSICTVLTSEGFFSYLHLSPKDMKKCILVKNKLDSVFKNIERPLLNNSEKKSGIRFGFAGNIRYETTLLFAEIIGKSFPQHQFIFWGSGQKQTIKKVEDLCSSYSNISYKGPFSNPVDLSSVYESIDIMVCNYDTKTINERLAEPNKLYECIFFNRPIIVTEGTYLGDSVKRLDIGTEINNSETNIYKFIKSLKPEKIEVWQLNESSISTIDLIEDFSPLFTSLPTQER